MLSFSEECIIVFQTPAHFQKNKDVSNTTFHYGRSWLQLKYIFEYIHRL